MDSKGKFLWITLEDEWTIWIIPAMSGHLQPKPGKYNKVIFGTKFKKFKDVIAQEGTVEACNNCGWLKPLN